MFLSLKCPIFLTYTFGLPVKETATISIKVLSFNYIKPLQSAYDPGANWTNYQEALIRWIQIGFSGLGIRSNSQP